MGELKEKEKAILNVIIDYMKEHHYSPSMREIASMLDISSTSTVFRHMENLRKKGYITWELSRPRTIQILKTNAEK
ncbi:LexA family protein [Parageobacillus thermoglucosidasius]|uniref:LexA family protein n=1 Tax=Parageobacillus thermoglucosidasius TaxID=1426 RepID=UPI002E1B3442|nr:winged helix-turn-helix transcriptional regulator [Parageobacillus thermoglucosidasius]MED4946530.1 winged helix-turn-helix transcriptional regulator [Parageobacillus thermoglucosidasius]MED4984917.1 winged helix-turn-helix transcriptional regulator [Parageobacillus thermoglucosidasius]